MTAPRDGSVTLVTGGAGYVGSVLLTDLLDRGRRVRVLDSLAVGDGSSLLPHWGRDGFEFVKGDVREPAGRATALQGVDEVVHLAGIVGDPACARDPEAARAVNLEATRALVDEALDAGARRFVFASTCSNYGKLEDPEAYATEDWELRPVSLYAETKVAAELDILARSSERAATTCLRFATVYGPSPRMRFDLTVNEFARDAARTGELVVYGEQFWRPYVHVRDAARAVVTVLEADPQTVGGEVFNVGDTGENYRKQDLVELLEERVPTMQVERVEKLEDPRDYRVSFGKIAERLGFAVTRNVAGGIDEILALLAAGVVDDPFAERYRN